MVHLTMFLLKWYQELRIDADNRQEAERRNNQKGRLMNEVVQSAPEQAQAQKQAEGKVKPEGEQLVQNEADVNGVNEQV